MFFFLIFRILCTILVLFFSLQRVKFNYTADLYVEHGAGCMSSSSLLFEKENSAHTLLPYNICAL